MLNFTWLAPIEGWMAWAASHGKILEKALLGMEGSYVELLTILALGLLAVWPVIVPAQQRQKWRRVNQLAGIVIFILVIFTCMGVFGMIRNFFRGLSEIGRENIIALYFASVPLTILAMSMLFGGFFCGWICPTGALQEFAGLLTVRWTNAWKHAGYPFSRVVLFIGLILAGLYLLWMLRLSTTRVFFLEDATIYWTLILITILILMSFRMAAWDQKLRRLRIVSFFIVLAGAVLGLRITSPVHFGFAKVYDPASILATVIVLLATLLIPRLWCRYLCPWREIIAWASRHSPRRIVLVEKQCVQCNTCGQTCPVDAVQHGRVELRECHMCLRCVDHCPSQALTLKDCWKEEKEC